MVEAQKLGDWRGKIISAVSWRGTSWRLKGRLKSKEENRFWNQQTNNQIHKQTPINRNLNCFTWKKYFEHFNFRILNKLKFISAQLSWSTFAKRNSASSQTKPAYQHLCSITMYYAILFQSTGEMRMWGGSGHNIGAFTATELLPFGHFKC